MENKILQKFV